MTTVSAELTHNGSPCSPCLPGSVTLDVGEPPVITGRNRHVLCVLHWQPKEGRNHTGI